MVAKFEACCIVVYLSPARLSASLLLFWVYGILAIHEEL